MRKVSRILSISPADRLPILSHNHISFPREQSLLVASRSAFIKSVSVQAKAAIGLDVGGNRVKAVVVEDEGTVLDQVVRYSLENSMERWAEVAQALAKLGEWAGAFGAAAHAMHIC
jgi:activator of 2-hydroxyglutaryl-CoA dehydratase